jgi:hypothetical protein
MLKATGFNPYINQAIHKPSNVEGYGLQPVHKTKQYLSGLQPKHKPSNVEG